MKLKFYLIAGLCLCLKLSSGQNYIPNYSFEDTARRVNTPLHPCKYWDAATNEGWNYYTPVHNAQYPDWGTPNNVNGYQQAKTGSAYVGINIYDLWSSSRSTLREYMQVQLKHPLTFDSTYCFQLYISLADSIHFASKNMLGVYFSSNAVSGNHRENLPYTPQLIVSPNTYIKDRLNWVKIDMQYQAQGGERYITIGNFNDTNYIDTAFVPGGGNETWMQSCYYYLDDIWLSHCDSLPENLNGLGERSLLQSVSVYPNPFVEDIMVESKSTQKLRFSLYNGLGQEVDWQAKANSRGYVISTSNLPQGLYWLRVSDGKETETIKLIKR